MTQGKGQFLGLTAEELSFAYRNGVRALDNCSFSVPGGVVAILGPNGAGKSTLIQHIVGTMEPDSGRLFVLGSSMADRQGRRSVQERLGYLPQHLSMFPAYTCEDVLRYVAWLRRVPSSEVEERLDHALLAVDLSSQRLTQVRALSGGMRQRLALAQALVNDPALVVLDEPTVGLDPEQRAKFRNHLRKVSDRSFVVIATHLVEDVAALATHVVVMAEGRARYSGSVHEFCGTREANDVAGPDVERAYLRLVGARA